MDETAELNAVKAFVSETQDMGVTDGPNGMKVALENLRRAQRLELSLRSKGATELMRSERSAMAERLVASFPEAVQPKVRDAVAFADFEVRVQMFMDYFRNIPQLPVTAKVPVVALAARGKELYLEAVRFAPEDSALADDLRDMIDYYDSASHAKPERLN